MTDIRNQIVSITRSWLHTPFHHQMRTRGVGCDCIGLIIGVAHEFGILMNEDFGVYHSLQDADVLEERLRKYALPTSIALGNVALFKSAKHGSHVGIITDYQNTKSYALVHACMKRKQVVEHRLLPELMREAEYFMLFSQ